MYEIVAEIVENGHIVEQYELDVSKRKGIKKDERI